MPEQNNNGGRVDLFLLTAAEQFIKGRVEPGLNGFPLWACGLGEICGQTVKAAGITTKPVELPADLVQWLMKGGK